VGWRGTLRSLNALNNQAIREANRARRARQRAQASLDRDRETILTRARNFEDRVQRDPVKALGLAYLSGVGFQGSNFEVSTPNLSLSFQLASDGPDVPSLAFYPTEARGSALSIQPLDLMVTRWATFLAVKVANHDAQRRGRLSGWVKRSDSATSRVFLLDPATSTYYYPLSSSLKGEVLPGHPKVGIIAFEPFRAPTSSVEIHFSDVKLGPQRSDTTSCSFHAASPALVPAVAGTMSSSSLQERIETEMDRQFTEAKRPSRAASILSLLVIGVVGFFVLLLLAALFRANA